MRKTMFHYNSHIFTGDPSCSGKLKNFYNPQIQKSGETKTKGSKSDKNWAESQFQAVIEI